MRTRATLVSTALVAGLAACGSSGGGEGGGALSSRALTDAVEDLCEDALDDVDDLDTPGTIGEWGEFGDEAGTILTTFADGLRALTPPARLRDELGDLIDNVAEQALAADELAVAGRAGDEDAIRDIVDDLRSLNVAMEPLALELDASACARTGTSVVDTTPTSTPSSTDTTEVTPTASQVDEVDLASAFVAPAGYHLESFDDGVGDIIATFAEFYPAIEAGAAEYGGASVRTTDGDYVGTLFIMLTNDTIPDLAGTAAAQEWSTLAYGDGFDSETAYTTAGGVSGTLYTFSDSTVAFSAVDDQVGLTFYTDSADGVDPFVDGLLDDNVTE